MRREVCHESSNSVDDWGELGGFMYDLVILRIITHRLKLFEHWMNLSHDSLGGLYGSLQSLIGIHFKLRIDIRVWRKEFWVWTLNGVLSKIGDPWRMTMDPLVPSVCPAIIMDLYLVVVDLNHLGFQPLPDSIFNVDPVSHFMFPILFRIKLRKILKLGSFIQRRFLLEDERILGLSWFTKVHFDA